MRPNPYVLHGLKYATLALAGVVVLVAVAALMKGSNTGSLSGRLVPAQQNGVTPTVHHRAEEAFEGYSLSPDTNQLITIPVGFDTPRVTFFGGPDYDGNTRYWGYCYSGHEGENKAEGKTGAALYDGSFFYSTAELKAQQQRPNPATNDLLGILQNKHAAAPEAKVSAAEILHGGDTCYIMVDARELPAALDDGDSDGVNNKREQLLGTDPHDRDTDHDGISDGTELFVTRTDPLNSDTDNDGLSDILEDKNTNGRIDPRETSPRNPDTDRDDLCDGDIGVQDGKQFGSACPEPHGDVCREDEHGDRICESKTTLPFSGEDRNRNGLFDPSETDPTNPRTFGINDYDFRWNQLGGAPKTGNAAPDFPIPEMPVSGQ